MGVSVNGTSTVIKFLYKQRGIVLSKTRGIKNTYLTIKLACASEPENNILVIITANTRNNTKKHN